MQEIADNLSDFETAVDFENESEGEDELVENNIFDSHSEQSADSDNSDFETTLQQQTSGGDFFFYIGKDNETIWKSTPVHKSSRTKAKNIINVAAGAKGAAKNTKNEKESFFTFITKEMIDKVVTCTNIYIQNKQSSNYQRDRDCKLTSRTEIEGLFGALFVVAVKKGNHTNVEELWAKDGTGLILLRAAFSYRRFLFLLRALRFDDIISRKEREKTDKLAAIRDIYTDLVNNCMNNYNLGQFITIDEMLHKFRGRCGFVQYMPQKPAKYGIKMYALCDSNTYYTWNFEIYCGTQRDGPYKSSNKPFDIVQRLVNPLKKSNRNLTTDNYYTSYPLAEYLLKNSITLIGTVKKNKKEIPPEFLPNKIREVGSSVFGFQDNITIVSYVPKKNKAVILLSTMDDTGEIDQITKKPDIILNYNKTKCGVDTVDQKCTSYTTQRITRRWPLAIFFRFLDIVGINSEVVFTDTNTTPQVAPPRRRRRFLTTLGFQLLEDHLKERAKILTLPRDIVEFLSKYRIENEISDTANQGHVGRCHMCSKHKNNKTTVTCNSCKQFVCKGHCEKIVKCNNCQYPPMEED